MNSSSTTLGVVPLNCSVVETNFRHGRSRPSISLISRLRVERLTTTAYLHAGGDLFYDGDVAMTSRPGAIRVLMAETLRDALARPQGRVELRMVVVLLVLVVDPLDEVTIPHIVLDVQGHVQGMRLGQPGPRGWRARARRGWRHDAEVTAEMRSRQDRRRRLPSPADQEEQRRTAQGTQGARVVAHPRTARVHVTWVGGRKTRVRVKAPVKASLYLLGAKWGVVFFKRHAWLGFLFSLYARQDIFRKVSLQHLGPGEGGALILDCM